MSVRLDCPPTDITKMNIATEESVGIGTLALGLNASTVWVGGYYCSSLCPNFLHCKSYHSTCMPTKGYDELI